MLNPHKADAIRNDPTIRRCIGFARSWKFETLVVGNLYALCSRRPDLLLIAKDPIGPDNDDHLYRMATESNLIVAAWGSNPAVDLNERGIAVAEMLANLAPLHILSLTLKGFPVHPLYQSSQLKPQRWANEPC
jgi:hypothetical protein